VVLEEDGEDEVGPTVLKMKKMLHRVKEDRNIPHIIK
jgi:hypothetical protein